MFLSSFALLNRYLRKLNMRRLLVYFIIRYIDKCVIYVFHLEQQDAPTRTVLRLVAGGMRSVPSA
jgi:hypothetical protein